MSFRVATVLAAAVLLGGGIAVWQASAHGKKHNPVRYEYVMKHGVPAKYQSLANPLAPDPDTLAAGAKLYAEHCALCHGPTGQGDGPAAKDLNPRPPTLQGMMKLIAGMKRESGARKHSSHGEMKHGSHREMSMMTDGYVYWTISEGGVPVESAMPAFEDVLSEKQRWQVISFMLNGFKAPPAEKEAGR